MIQFRNSMSAILFCLLLSKNCSLYAQNEGVEQFLVEEFLMNLEDVPEFTDANPIFQDQISARKSPGYYSKMSLEDLIRELDNYVYYFSEGKRDKLKTNYIPGSASNLNSIICNFGLKLSKQNGDWRPGWNTGNIYSKKGYSKKELIRHYRRMKGDVLEKLYSEYTIDEFITVIDKYVFDYYENNRDKFNTNFKEEIKADIINILKYFALALAKKNNDFVTGWNTNNIFLKKGYSVKNVINHYRRFKGDVIDEKVSFSKLSFRELIRAMDKIVFNDFSNDPKALPMQKINGKSIDLQSFWKNYGIKLSIERGEFKAGWTTRNIHLQPGYSYKELKDHYIAHRTQCRHTFDFSGKISPSP